MLSHSFPYICFFISNSFSFSVLFDGEVNKNIMTHFGARSSLLVPYQTPGEPNWEQINKIFWNIENFHRFIKKKGKCKFLIKIPDTKIPRYQSLKQVIPPSTHPLTQKRLRKVPSEAQRILLCKVKQRLLARKSNKIVIKDTKYVIKACILDHMKCYCIICY